MCEYANVGVGVCMCVYVYVFVWCWVAVGMDGCVVRSNSNPLLLLPCVGRRSLTKEKFLSIFVMYFKVYGMPYEYVIEATVSGHTCCWLSQCCTC